MRVASSSFFRQFTLQQYSRYLYLFDSSFYIGDLRREKANQGSVITHPYALQANCIIYSFGRVVHLKWPHMRILSNSSIPSSIMLLYKTTLYEQYLRWYSASDSFDSMTLYKQFLRFDDMQASTRFYNAIIARARFPPSFSYRTNERFSNT